MTEMGAMTIRVLLILVASCLVRDTLACNPHDAYNRPCNDRTRNGDFRLADGTNNNNGRVEVYYNGHWGTICDDSFSTYEANLVCKNLGFGRGAYSYHSSAYFGQGSGYIWLDDLDCDSSSRVIENCRTKSWGSHDCSHGEDVGVTCLADGTLRLRTSGYSNRGRPEVFYNGQWGTICDGGWSDADSGVICRQLGYSDEAMPYKSAFFGQGSGPIWLDGTGCGSDPPNIGSCTHPGWGVHNSNHGRDAAVICAVSGSVRLRGTRSSSSGNYYKGRVEVYYNGEWGTICDDYFGTDESNLVCRLLGYRRAVRVYSGASLGQGTGRIWRDDLACTPHASTLHDCGGRPWGEHSCTHAEDVGVECTNSASYSLTQEENQAIQQSSIDLEGMKPDGALRLSGGHSEGSGRLEVLHDGAWGSVCDQGFTLNEANVACRAMGYLDADEVHPGAYFGMGSGPLLLSELSCDVNATDVTACMTRGWGEHDCHHEQDVGVKCQPHPVVTEQSRIKYEEREELTVVIEDQPTDDAALHPLGNDVTDVVGKASKDERARSEVKPEKDLTTLDTDLPDGPADDAVPSALAALDQSSMDDVPFSDSEMSSVPIAPVIPAESVKPAASEMPSEPDVPVVGETPAALEVPAVAGEANAPAEVNPVDKVI